MMKTINLEIDFLKFKLSLLGLNYYFFIFVIESKVPILLIRILHEIHEYFIVVQE